MPFDRQGCLCLTRCYALYVCWGYFLHYGMNIDFMAAVCFLIINVMKKEMLVVSVAAIMVALAGCCNTNAQDERKAVNEQFRQDREFMNQAIKHKSPDVMRADVVDNTVLYTHIYDGIVDVKAYTYDGDTCVAVERVYTFPNQMSALRHYRNAIEKAELYENIELIDNQVKYKLKEEQRKLETKGLTKDQLKAKFDKQIATVKADLEKDNAKMKAGFKKDKADLKKDCEKKPCCKKDKK